MLSAASMYARTSATVSSVAPSRRQQPEDRQGIVSRSEASFCLVAGSSRGEKGMFFDASKMSLPSPRTSMPSKPRSLAIE